VHGRVFHVWLPLSKREQAEDGVLQVGEYKAGGWFVPRCAATSTSTTKCGRIRASTISRQTSSWREEQDQRPVGQRAGTLRYMGPPRPGRVRMAKAYARQYDYGRIEPNRTGFCCRMLTVELPIQNRNGYSAKSNVRRIRGHTARRRTGTRAMSEFLCSFFSVLQYPVRFNGIDLESKIRDRERDLEFVAETKCSQRGRPSQANRGPKNQDRSHARPKGRILWQPEMEAPCSRGR
jgi:hypothetical protein